MLSTKRRGVLAGAIVGLCAICIAVCAQAVVLPSHAAESAQALTTSNQDSSGANSNAPEAASSISAAIADDEVGESGNEPSPLSAKSGSSEAGQRNSSLPSDGASNYSESLDFQKLDSTEGARQPASTASSGNRTWVIDYERVWVPNLVEVEVEPERVETVYETRDILMCNVSGCGFTTENAGEMSSHWASHAMQGVDEGYSSISQQIAVGTSVIPAVTRLEDHGEYKLVESGGHWE